MKTQQSKLFRESAQMPDYRPNNLSGSKRRLASIGYATALVWAMLVTLPASVQAATPQIVNAAVSSTTFTIKLQNFGAGAATVQFNGLTVGNVSYNQSQQV